MARHVRWVWRPWRGQVSQSVSFSFGANFGAFEGSQRRCAGRDLRIYEAAIAEWPVPTAIW
jgi:hypothetical protein